MPQIRPDSNHRADARLVELATGTSLSVIDRGSGLPVVMIHGVTCSNGFFHANTDALAANGFRAIAIDLRGHGASVASDGGHTIAQYARDLNALLDALSIDRCALIGWSMGNLVVWEFMRQFGAGRVAGHVNISQGPTDLTQPDFPFAPLSMEALTGFIQAAQGDWRATMGHFVPVMFKDEPSEADLAWCVDEIAMLGANAGSCILLDQTLYDAREAIAAENVPTINVWGADEKLIPIAMGEWCRDNIAGSEYVVFESSGHCPQIEEPDRFNRLAIEWLRSLG